MNVNFTVNALFALLIVIGYFIPTDMSLRDPILQMGLFGFSGAITNWLAIHMLFEKVPGLYGSGIIPLKFEAFKSAIRNLIMNQFFTAENIRKFMQDRDKPVIHVERLLDKLDYDILFDGFLEMVRASKFGGMLAMFGGMNAIEPLREPFQKKLKSKLLEMTASPKFQEALASGGTEELHEAWRNKIAAIVESRLDELTPQMVKDIVQNMIRSHLGWLVIWGGVFGALIGLFSSLVKSLTT